MYSITTLFLTLTALVASVQAAPSAFDPRGAAVGAVFAGAPSDGVYPEDMDDAAGWESEAWKPTHEEQAQDAAPADTTVTWSTTVVSLPGPLIGIAPDMQDVGGYATPMHGSGSTPPTDMDSCYQMCQAQYGGAGLSSAAHSSAAAPTADKATSTHAASGSTASTHPASGSTSASAHVTSAAAPAGGSAHPTGGGGGGAATHTIIVAPTQGVLRFVPFAVKAAQGDTLEYIWGGGPHSATLSNGTNVCSKSTEPGAFDSGKLNATATYSTVYDKNTTAPSFYYCTVGQHCANGMFGIINNVSNELTDKATAPRPDTTAGNGGKTTPGVDGWITSWGLTNPDNQKKIDAVKAACKDAPGAWDWGSKWDWDSMLSTTVTKEVVVENTLYTRLMATYNPAMLKNEPLTTDWKAAPDLTSFAADYAGSAAGSSSGGAYGSSAATGVAAASASGSASASASADAASAGAGNGAGRIGTSSLMTVMAVLAVSVLLV